jgi:hypothetical protein
MNPERNKATLNSETIIKKVVSRQYTFASSQNDLALLKSLGEGTTVGTKSGDPNFQAYAAALNVATEFGSQALDVLDRCRKWLIT